MDKLKLQTHNIVDENIRRIGELFPNCLTERLDENGKPEAAIDFDMLRQELSKDIVEGPEERYQFTWPDKRNAIRLANAPTTDTLRPCRKESVDFDNTQNLYIEGHNLVVIGTLERETGRKVNLQGVTEDFDKESVGVVWVRFVSGTPDSRIYLFKDMPEIEHALTASDRVRVREERLKNQKKDNPTRGEIAFQFLTPRLTDFGDLTVFAVEAFMPYYHTETRMNYGYYGYYGGYPYTYTVFDGYDFFSEVLLAFDQEGHLQWQQSLKFDNELTFELFPHAAEGACYDELVVASPYRNKLRYAAFDAQGQPLMNLQEEKLAPIYGADYVEDEYFAQMARWYGSRFLIYGSQIIQNGSQPKPRRTVYYLQKVQYD